MALLDTNSLEFITHSPEQTHQIGFCLGKLLIPGDTLCLFGDLGAGKTVLAQGIGRGWGTAVRITSPTYTIVHQYNREQDLTLLYHLDCYRIQSDGDAESIGLDDILNGDHVAMIEWANQVPAYLPDDRIEIKLTDHAPTDRTLHFIGTGERSLNILKQLQSSAFGA